VLVSTTCMYTLTRARPPPLGPAPAAADTRPPGRGSSTTDLYSAVVCGQRGRTRHTGQHLLLLLLLVIIFDSGAPWRTHAARNASKGDALSLANQVHYCDHHHRHHRHHDCYHHHCQHYHHHHHCNYRCHRRTTIANTMATTAFPANATAIVSARAIAPAAPRSPWQVPPTGRRDGRHLQHAPCSQGTRVRPP